MMIRLHKPISARAYATAFIGLVSVLAACLCVFAWQLGPPAGDLTRVGGLSERRYGWNGVSDGFAESHFSRTSLMELMAGADPGEILVLGDSYSFEQGNNITWTNTLHALTGRTIRLVELRTFKEVQAYFQSPAYEKHAPEVVVIETVERLVFWRSETALGNDTQCAEVPQPKPITARPRAVERSQVDRRSAFLNFDELVSWGALAARVRMLLPRMVTVAALRTPAHFSSADPAALLLYFDDITNHAAPAFGGELSDKLPGRIACVLKNLIAAGAQHSSVYLTVAPDKRTLYEPFLVAPLPARQFDMLKIAREAAGPSYIDLYRPLNAAVTEMTPDVYWPNDTHWGSTGHALVGATAAAAMTGAK